VSRARTVGSTYRLWRLQRTLDQDTLDALPDSQQSGLARLLVGGGDDASRLLTRIDTDNARKLARAAYDGCTVPGLSVGPAVPTPTSTPASARTYSMQGPSQFALGTLVTDRCDVDLDRFSGRLGDSDLSDAYGVTDDVVRQLDADETEEFVRLVNANGDDALRLAQRAADEDDIDQLRTVLNLRDAEFGSAKIDNFVDAAGADSGRILRAVDPGLRRSAFELNLERFDSAGSVSPGLKGEFRRGVLKQAADVPSTSQAVSDYLFNLDRIGRSLDNGAEINGADGLVRAVARGSGAFEGDAFEVRRISKYADETESGTVRSITVDYSGRLPDDRKDIDYRVERSDSVLNIEAKSPRAGSDLADRTREYVRSANEKFTDIDEEIGPNEERILEIESRESTDLQPGEDDGTLRSLVAEEVNRLNEQGDVNLDKVCVVGSEATTLIEISDGGVTLSSDRSGICTR
jgi:hypothetical protein